MENTWNAKKRATIKEATQAKTNYPSHQPVNDLSKPIIVTITDHNEQKQLDNKTEDHCETVNKFSIDYSKQGRAKCKVCYKVIAKNELRIGSLTPFKTHYITKYLHINCAFKSFNTVKLAEHVISDTNQIDRFDLINQIGKDGITKLIADENNNRQFSYEKSPCSKPKVPTHAPSKLRRLQLNPTNLPSFNIMFTNADQLTPTKMSELTERIQREKPIVIAVCELKPKTHNNRTEKDYHIPGYSIHPVNLDSNIGKGIAIYTHSSLDQSTVQIKPDFGFDEFCLLEIRLRGGDLLLFGCFYRSPTTTSTSNENNENLNKLLQCISKKRYTHKCFVGDFNFKDSNWISWTTNHDEHSKENKFIETIRSCYLHQHLVQPTRRRGNDTPSLLDLLFTDEIMQVSDITHHAPLGKSDDHSVITFKFNCYLDHSKPKERFIYEKGDYQAMRNDLVGSNWIENYLAS